MNTGSLPSFCLMMVSCNKRLSNCDENGVTVHYLEVLVTLGAKLIHNAAHACR